MNWFNTYKRQVSTKNKKVDLKLILIVLCEMKLCYQQVGKGKNAILGGSQELFLQCKYFDLLFQ